MKYVTNCWLEVYFMSDRAKGRLKKKIQNQQITSNLKCYKKTDYFIDIFSETR